ncbi:hypothetical protein Avbf_18856 [Armadillidium vulgare]|nr:hypothetical protein Avbf_18856 [Armadillidium vulgare]
MNTTGKPSPYPSLTPSQTPNLYPSPTPSQTSYLYPSYEVCPDGDTEVSLILCRKATRVCLPCQSEENICDEGKYFSMQDSKCYSDPDTPEMTCLSTMATPHTPPPPPPPGEVFSSEFGFPVLCSNDNLIPNDDRIIKNFCSLSYTCERKARKLERYEALCDNYYQCVFDEGYWQIVKMTCSETWCSVIRKINAFHFQGEDIAEAHGGLRSVTLLTELQRSLVEEADILDLNLILDGLDQSLDLKMQSKVKDTSLNRDERKGTLNADEGSNKYNLKEQNKNGSKVKLKVKDNSTDEENSSFEKDNSIYSESETDKKRQKNRLKNKKKKS